jgi:hypothetical protein
LCLDMETERRLKITKSCLSVTRLSISTLTM